MVIIWKPCPECQLSNIGTFFSLFSLSFITWHHAQTDVKKMEIPGYTKTDKPPQTFKNIIFDKCFLSIKYHTFYAPSLFWSFNLPGGSSDETVGFRVLTPCIFLPRVPVGIIQTREAFSQWQEWRYEASMTHTSTTAWKHQCSIYNDIN